MRKKHKVIEPQSPGSKPNTLLAKPPLVPQETALTETIRLLCGFFISVTAVIVVLLLLFTICVVAALIYFLWYRPKREFEDSAKAAALYANQGI